MTETGLLMGGAIFLAYVVKGITGFGNTLVFSSIVGLFLDNRNISPVELVVGYPSNLLISPAWCFWAVSRGCSSCATRTPGC